MQANSHNTKHRSTVYFPAMVTRKDQMSKQARFLVRMALACHQNGTSYDVKWERRGIGEGAFFAATLTAEGNIPMPKPFPKAPKTRTTAAWKPNLYDASYRLEAALIMAADKSQKWAAGHVIEHSCGLSLVRFGDGSETGEIVCTAEKDAKDGWSVTHTRSGRGMGFTWRFNDAVSSLLAIAHYCDWHQDIEALKDDEGARKAQLLLRSESCQKRQDRENALQALECMGGPIEPPAMPEPPAKPTVRTRTTPMPVEGRIAAIPESNHAKLDSASREWSDWVKAGKPATEPTPVVAVPEVAATSAPEPKIDVPQVADSPKTETPQVAPLPQVLHFDNGVRFVDVSQTDRGWLMRARSRDGNIAVPTILFATRDEAVARAEKFIGAQVDAMPATVESPQPAAVEPAAPIAPKTETPQGIENQEAARKHAMMTATYSPEDNKLRLYSVGRLDPETYARVKAAGFAWAPKQGLFVAPRWTPEREDLLIELAGEVGDEDTSLVARAEDRADRFSEYSASRANDARMAKGAVDRIADGIPMGQPILVGHHSERHARRDAERIENGMRKAVKMWETAEYWKYRAAGAIRAAKYKELPAVRHRRIKGLEADLRSCIADYTPQQPVHRIMQTGYNDTEPSIHVWVGPRGRGGHWVKESSLPAIKASRARWEQHYQNRIEYEKAMLAESGGIAADSFDIKVGGRIHYGAEWLPVLRINRANGEIRSVTVAAPGRFTWKSTLTIEIEAVKQYRDPEPGDEQKARQSVKKAPLCNYPGEGFRHITKAEWEKIWTDYKSTRTIDETHRVRYAIFGGQRINVYLTDSKRIDPPADAKPIEAVKLPIELAATAPTQPKPAAPQAEPEAAEFAEMRESLRHGVQVVAAPQLFPTPPEVAARMVELADIQPHSAVLEPSAGTGRLLDALLNADGTGWKAAHVSRLVAVERNCKLADTLRRTYAAGDVRNADFLECTADELGQFDTVIMNPPFENGADIKHIQHAAGMLKPGGKLVAICANGPRQNDKLKPLADQWEELPVGTFAGTNVRAVLLTISKPKPAEPAAVAPAAQPAATNDTQQRIARLLAELKASRLPAPAGKMAVRYPDGRVGYIPDPAAKPPRSQGIKTAGVARKHVLPSLSLGAAARAPA